MSGAYPRNWIALLEAGGALLLFLGLFSWVKRQHPPTMN